MENVVFSKMILNPIHMIIFKMKSSTFKRQVN